VPNPVAQLPPPPPPPSEAVKALCGDFEARLAAGYPVYEDCVDAYTSFGNYEPQIFSPVLPRGFSQGPCQPGYYDRTKGGSYRDFSVGQNCVGGFGIVDDNNNCACVPNSVAPSDLIPPAGFSERPCLPGYYDSTYGNTYEWSKQKWWRNECPNGPLCPGGLLNADRSCDCACKPNAVVREGFHGGKVVSSTSKSNKNFLIGVMIGLVILIAVRHYARS
jgi:hypothetical protein